MKKQFVFAFAIGVIFLSNSVHARMWEATYTGEYLANTTGGLVEEEVYIGHLDLSLTIDTAEFGLWDSGTLFVYVVDDYRSKKFSSDVVGDSQGISGNEAPRTTRLLELWYEHLLYDEQLSLLLGIHDYNSEFNVTEYGGLFLNGSFGMTAELAAGGRPSTFPLSALGARAKVTPNEDWTFLFGVYDGDPDDPDDVEHFPRSDFDGTGGVFLASEAAYHFGELPGTFKLGFWYNTGEFNDVVELNPQGNAVIRDGNYGGYVVIDKMLYREEGEQGLGVFLQFGMAPEHLNEIDYYAGGGLYYKGLVPSRDDDELGLAVAYAHISNELSADGSRDDAETVVELTYSAVINDHVRIQPNAQFIFDPGANPSLDDAIVVGIRFEIAL